MHEQEPQRENCHSFILGTTMYMYMYIIHSCCSVRQSDPPIRSNVFCTDSAPSSGSSQIQGLWSSSKFLVPSMVAVCAAVQMICVRHQR